MWMRRQVHTCAIQYVSKYNNYLIMPRRFPPHPYDEFHFNSFFFIADFFRFHLVCMRKLSRTSTNCIRHPANVWAMAIALDSHNTQTFAAEFLLWCLNAYMCLSIELWANSDEKTTYTREIAGWHNLWFNSSDVCVFLFLLFSSCFLRRVNETKVHTHIVAANKDNSSRGNTRSHLMNGTCCVRAPWIACTTYQCAQI